MKNIPVRWGWDMVLVADPKVPAEYGRRQTVNEVLTIYGSWKPGDDGDGSWVVCLNVTDVNDLPVQPHTISARLTGDSQLGLLLRSDRGLFVSFVAVKNK